MTSSLETMTSIGIAISPRSAPLVMPIWTCRPRRLSERIELRHVSAMPSPSTETCAPPLVISLIALAGSALPACTVSTAPSCFAISSLSASMSTPMTLAPSAVAICTAESPMPPQPCTATHSPAWTLPWSNRPWNAVM